VASNETAQEAEPAQDSALALLCAMFVKDLENFPNLREQLSHALIRLQQRSAESRPDP